MKYTMAEPENIHQVPTPYLILYRRYYDYKGLCQRVVYLVEDFQFDDCRIIYTFIPRVFVDLQ